MNILGITIMRTKTYKWMEMRANWYGRYFVKRIELEHKLIAANAEIARLREIKAKYADLLIAHEALKAEHTRWTDRGPDGRFVRNE